MKHGYVLTGEQNADRIGHFPPRRWIERERWRADQVSRSYRDTDRSGERRN